MKTKEIRTASAVAPVGHTPGPWAIENDTRVDANGNALWRVLGATDNETGGILVADVNTGWQQHEANARLIAAAPDLLAALEKADRELQRLGASDNDATLGENEIVKEIRAAIAKANG